jgi:hypothetical protein
LDSDQHSIKSTNRKSNIGLKAQREPIMPVPKLV